MAILPKTRDRTMFWTGVAVACLLAAPAWAQTSQTGTAANRDAGTLSHDCTDVSIDYADEPGLTREERIARMDRAFQRSLSRFEECASAGAASGGGASGGSAVGAGDASGGDGQSGSGISGTAAAEGVAADGTESDGADTSTAASDISGPDAPQGTTASRDGGSTASGDISGDEPTVTASTTPATPPTGREGTGTRPEEAARDGAQRGEMPIEETAADAPAGDEELREASRTLDNGKLPEDIPPADNDSALEAQIRKAAIEETDPELKKRLWDEYRRYKGLPVPN